MYNIILKNSYDEPMACFGEVTNLNETNGRVTFNGDGEERELTYNPEYNRWEITVRGHLYKFGGYEILNTNQVIDRAKSGEATSDWYRHLVSQYHLTRDDNAQPVIQHQPPTPSKNNKFHFE